MTGISASFVSEPPKVYLVNGFDDAYNNAVATARTCYSARVVTASDVTQDERSRAQRDAIAESTYAAGHHTTLQHATFQFVLENVSRQLIWSFLHAHPFYNSEQVSQRYVAVRAERVLVPHLPPRAAERYRATVALQMSCYGELVQLLTPAAAAAYFRIFPARKKHAEKWASAVKKKAQEVARYALPIATFAHLYHTVSGLTLHRYHRLCGMLDVPREVGEVVRLMVAEVSRRDPLFFQRIEDPLPPEETHEHQLLASLKRTSVTQASARQFCAEFDRELGGKSSRLVDPSPYAEASLARAVRTVVGASVQELNDDAAILTVLSPQHNPYLAGALNLTSLGKLARAMVHVHYSFQKKLSHTADSQDQRHRTTPASRPVLHTHYKGGEPDVVIPALLAEVPEAHDRFMQVMGETWRSIDALLADGVEPELALYLLPNAFPIRFYESGDLAGWHHKWTTRLCFNSQEEIWRASLEEVQQVRAVHPRIGRHLEPPCGLRREAGMRPLCPEGPRYCGVPVWRTELDSYRRLI